MNGHWFCFSCNDVVNMRTPAGRWDARRGVECPVCHRPECDWIPDSPAPATPSKPAPLDPAIAADLFAKLKDATK